MSSVTYVLSIIVMLAVAAVLVRGLVNMARGGSGNLSNKLMQACASCCNSSRWC
jgi:hypothetical protein